MMARKKQQKGGKEKIIAAAIVIVFLAGIAYFLFSPGTPSNEIPAYVTGDARAMYEWAKTAEGAALLEQLPCYCGCKFEGHKHTRHCFWRDDGTLDKHGITCSVCLDIAKKAKKMHDEGRDACAIRKAIDKFYEPNKHLGTDTPMPAGCA